MSWKSSALAPLYANTLSLASGALLLAVSASPLAMPPSAPAKATPRSAIVPTVVPNDNRRPAGTLRGGFHHLAMEAVLGDWNPDGDRAPGV